MKLLMNKFGNPADPVKYRVKNGPVQYANSVGEVPVGAMYFDGVWFEKEAQRPNNVPALMWDEEQALQKKYGGGVRYAGD
jgi:hypothetical protein